MTQHAIERRFAKLAAAHNQKAARLGIPGRISAIDLGYLYMQSGGYCYYDGTEVSPLGVSFDHRIPLIAGGANAIRNLVVSCITCQRTKFTKSEEEFEVARQLRVACEVCGTMFRPRWADYRRGYGRTCSRKCAGQKGGQQQAVASIA